MLDLGIFIFAVSGFLMLVVSTYIAHKNRKVDEKPVDDMFAAGSSLYGRLDEFVKPEKHKQVNNLAVFGVIFLNLAILLLLIKVLT